MLNLVLFGPPGSGKGTQAEKLVEKYNLFHISTGDMFRYELKNNTELGQLAKSYSERGELVPDSVTIAMLRKRVEDHPDVKGFIFDGFPRTIPQAEALDTLLKEMNQSVTALIALKVEENEIVKRLLNRGKTSGRADDNDESIIRNRMQVYEKETSVVYDYYATFDKSMSIHGVGSVEDIFEVLCQKIDHLSHA
jgi:adenylate kinase